MTLTVAQTALENLKTAGVDNQVTIIIGPAADSLAKFGSEDPFDLVFIDADKPSNAIYFSEAKRLVRKGGVIVCLSYPLPSFTVLHFRNEYRLWIMSSMLDA